MAFEDAALGSAVYGEKTGVGVPRVAGFDASPEIVVLGVLGFAGFELVTEQTDHDRLLGSASDGTEGIPAVLLTPASPREEPSVVVADLVLITKVLWTGVLAGLLA